MAGQQRALMPDKPFFLYFAPGATHAPIHAPAHVARSLPRRVRQGWDTLREEIFARQKQLGIVPPDCELTARPDGIPAWSDVADDMKPVLTRQMELYAAFLEHTDYCIGQVIDAVEELGALDDTLTLRHHRRQRRVGRGYAQRDVERVIDHDRHGPRRNPEFLRERLESFGTPDSYPQYSLGWGHAMNTPYQWTKRIGVALGRDAERLDRSLASWHQGPRRTAPPVPSRHRRRTHVPRGRRTAAAVQVDGVTQQPIEGVSMV